MVRLCYFMQKCSKALATINGYGLSGPSRGPFGALLGRPGAVLGRPGALLGRRGGLRPSGGPLGGFWGASCASLGALLEAFGGLCAPSWAVLGLSWAVLEPSWAILWPSWGPPGLSWGDLGTLLGRLGRRESSRCEYAKNVRFPKGMGRFLCLGAFLEGRLGGLSGCLKACLALVERPWAVLGSCWTSPAPFLRYLGRSWSPSWPVLEASEAILGAGRRPGWGGGR